MDFLFGKHLIYFPDSLGFYLHFILLSFNFVHYLYILLWNFIDMHLKNILNRLTLLFFVSHVISNTLLYKEVDSFSDHLSATMCQLVFQKVEKL